MKNSENNDISKDPLLTILEFGICCVMAFSIAFAAEDLRERNNAKQANDNTIINETIDN